MYYNIFIVVIYLSEAISSYMCFAGAFYHINETCNVWLFISLYNSLFSLWRDLVMCIFFDLFCYLHFREKYLYIYMLVNFQNVTIWTYLKLPSIVPHYSLICYLKKKSHFNIDFYYVHSHFFCRQQRECK